MKSIRIIVYLSIIVGIALAIGMSNLQMAKAEKLQLPFKNGHYVPAGSNCPKPGTAKYDSDYPEGTITFSSGDLSCNDGNIFGYLFSNVKTTGHICTIKGKTFTGAGGHNMGKFDLIIAIESETSISIKGKGVTPSPVTNEAVRYYYCGN
jgi:hypothetical protein